MTTKFRSCGHLVDDLGGSVALCPFCHAPRDQPGVPGLTHMYGPSPMAGGMPMAVSPPPKGMRITGGILTILLSLIVGGVMGLMAVLGSMLMSKTSELQEAAHLSSSEASAVGGIILYMGVAFSVFGVLGIVMGALCAAGKPAGAIGGGVIMVLLAGLLGLGLARNFSPMGAGLTGLAVLAAVFSFMGVGQCRAWQAYKAAGGR